MNVQETKSERIGNQVFLMELRKPKLHYQCTLDNSSERDSIIVIVTFF